MVFLTLTYSNILFAVAALAAHLTKVFLELIHLPVASYVGVPHDGRLAQLGDEILCIVLNPLVGEILKSETTAIIDFRRKFQFDSQLNWDGFFFNSKNQAV